MKMPGFLVSGVLATLLIGVPFWYLLVNYYPQYADNWLYLGVGGLVFVSLAGAFAKFAARRK
jgi:hypothetical protein